MSIRWGVALNSGHIALKDITLGVKTGAPKARKGCAWSGAKRNPRTHPTMRPSSQRAHESGGGLDGIVSAYSLRHTAAAPTERDPLLPIFLGLRSRSTPGSVLLRLRRSLEFGHFSSRWAREFQGRMAPKTAVGGALLAALICAFGAAGHSCSAQKIYGAGLAALPRNILPESTNQALLLFNGARLALSP